MRFPRLFYCFLMMMIFLNCSKKDKKESDDLKIIALSPAIVETIFFLGKGDEIVGASSFCNYPEESKNIPEVANISDINLEFAVKLNPDIVLLMPSQQNIADKLALLNIKTAVIHQESLDDILNSFLTVGKEINTEIRAKFVHDSLKTVLDSYKNSSKNQKVLISVGREYGTDISYIYSSGNTGFLNDIIILLGYQNSLETSVPYPKISTETIMSLNPDLIIDLAPGGINLTESELLNDWKIFHNSNAWKNNCVLIFKGDYTTIPGPRIFDFIKELNEKGL